MRARSFIVLALLLAPMASQAETVVRIAESVLVAPDQQVENDFYAAASNITQTGSVAGDMYAAAGEVTVKGPIETDLTIFAGRAAIDAAVGDDVRLAVGEATISGDVGGDVFVLGGSLTILPTASVSGDVYVFGGEAEIAGAVAGSVRGRVEQLRIDTTVGGGVDVVARQRLTLGSRTEVAGDVQYRSQRELVRAPEAVINGSVLANDLPAETDEPSLATQLLPSLIMLFGSLVLYLLARDFMTAVVTHSLTHPLRVSFIGILLSLVAPALAILLMVTVLGLVVGIGTLGAFIVVLALSYSVAPMVLGVLMWRLFGGTPVLQPFAILVGVCALQLLLLIPTLGTLIALSLSLIAAGSLAEITVKRLMAC